KSNHDEIVRGFEQLLDRESFNGGTDITRALFDASDYLKRNARPEARPPRHHPPQPRTRR
ncbi:MAG: hypothetical protein ACK6DZ_19455, partial [Acidobacteriota bacterium]